MTAQSAWQTQFGVETCASPEAIWALFRDVQNWPRWNAGIEEIALEGPFAAGTHFMMKPPGQDALRSVLTEVRENEGFVDETRVGDLVIAVAHRIEKLPAGRTRVTYAVDARGPDAAEIGPMVSADFPDVVAALVAAAEGAQS